jgi:hypothetical protein
MGRITQKPAVINFLLFSLCHISGGGGYDPEPEFLNSEGAQESIPRNQFRQAM